MTDINLLKENAKLMWSTFSAFENITGMAAPELVKFSGLQKGDKVCDIGCGTGVVAITAAQSGAKVKGSDLTPKLIERARENSEISGFDIDFQVADVEELPYDDNSFDYVLSQFGHMFAPQPFKATEEMLRVLKPGGVIAFSTWPPELLTGRLFVLTAKYGKPQPDGVHSPVEWGEVAEIEKRLGDRVKDISFHRSQYGNPALSPAHMRMLLEKHIGPIAATVQMLKHDESKLTLFRSELDVLLGEYFENNTVIQSYLMTRAVKI